MAAPTLTTQTLLDDSKRTVIKIVIPSGGDTDAADVKIVDVSELSGAPSAVSIEKIEFSLYNMAVNIEWDATADVSSMVLSGTGSFDFRKGSVLTNNSGAGKTGDVFCTTINYSTTGVSGGTLILHVVK